VENKGNLSLNTRTKDMQSTSAWRRDRDSKTPSNIYLSIKDKGSKELAITTIGLEN
jgi:hypothetical protein